MKQKCKIADIKLLTYKPASDQNMWDHDCKNKMKLTYTCVSLAY